MAKLSIPISIAGFSIPGSLATGPLAKLYGSEIPKGTNQLIYPRNLGTDSTRAHVIVFDVMVKSEVQPNLSNQAGQVVDGIVEAGKATFQIANNVGLLPGTNNNTVEVQAGVARLQEAGSEILEVSQTFATTDVNRTVGTQIALYVPDTVNVQYNAGYKDVSATNALGRPYFIAQAAASAGDALVNALSGGFDAKKLINAAGNDPYLRKVAGDIIGSALGGNPDDFTALLQSQIGKAMNPQLQVLFEGINFRTFQFDFTLTPFSQQEANTIKEIVKAFKRAAMPGMSGNSVGGTSMFFDVPDRFNISFYHNGKPNYNVHKIGTSVLENVTVDYAPIGWATFGDGVPVQTRLTLQFKEVELISREKIDEGY
jgi:hypothetical protein